MSQLEDLQPNASVRGILPSALVTVAEAQLYKAVTDYVREEFNRAEALHNDKRAGTKAQEAFQHDPEVQVLLATDAAGEGINLQRAHLMVNYDLPWNPNRLEQRFGRIHRIGQTEVCHFWNLVAEETREGDVYRALAHDAMDASRVARVREEMERAEARRLQPHYIESFFLEALKQLGGTARQREPRRYEVTHVPAPSRTISKQFRFCLRWG